MKRPLFLLVALTLLTVFQVFEPKAANAWSFEVGSKYLYPKLGLNDQTYEDSNGNKLIYKPQVENSEEGTAFAVTIIVDQIRYSYEQSVITYNSTISASNSAVTEDTAVKAKMVGNRLGVGYHLEREVAGVYGEMGASQEVETIKTSSNEWVYKTTTPFLRYGVDFIFGSLRLRGEQLQMKVGNHNVKLNSFGLLFTF